MSSHHIVREKQEPALLIAGLDTFPDELLGQLLEWSPTVIVTAATAEQVQAYGIKIDWLVADGMIDLQQSDIKLIPPGNADAVSAALEQLITQGYHAVNLIADEINLTQYANYFDLIDLVIFNQEKKILAVYTGYSKWKPAGERIEILTLSHNLVYTGLLPVADNIYKTISDGFFSLQFTDPYLLIAEAL